MSSGSDTAQIPLTFIKYNACSTELSKTIFSVCINLRFVECVPARVSSSEGGPVAVRRLPRLNHGIARLHRASQRTRVRGGP